MLFAALGFLGIKGTVDKLNSITKTEKNAKYGIYYDGNNRLRYKNGKLIISAWHYGDLVYKDIKTSQIYVNKTLIDAHENAEKAKQAGEQFFLRQTEHGDYNRLGNNSIIGNRYCKIGEPFSKPYVKRQIIFKDNTINYRGEYYMNMAYEFCYPTNETNQNDLQKFGINKDKIQKYIMDTINEQIKNNGKMFLPNTETLHHYGASNNYKEAKEKISRWR